jgi:hypothetical protein
MPIFELVNNNHSKKKIASIRKFSHSIRCSALIILLILFFLPGANKAFAQVEQKDFSDVVAQWKKAPAKKLNAELQVGKTYYSFLPVVGYAPANGFLAGGAISLTRRFGPVPTNLSSGMLNFQAPKNSLLLMHVRKYTCPVTSGFCRATGGC